MTHEMARALCEAGYMTVTEYLGLCEKNGWKTVMSDDLELPACIDG